ncbi:hypothetical protein HYPSUDRAFT_67026 [Hypholoma sublateritium FD-334 SS-4]|uniref:Pyridoxamine 5'-phosphate oxidase N-terminal domain-containing protein n=1 Tax=Hypholoma sublateritium (strain FD-334 SS-4) TaxID=945553 RepID=A0A0D2MG23_HYPSF|nr:hypothetical protein HYPSUDRAFT_67026 [Hypholoma sublateritium FD-334 SS-4]
MGQFYTEIPTFLIPWIKEQKMFWVATAPLSETGHVNVSPKGFNGTFHIVDQTRVWYEDMSGSGAETVAHLRENERITIMFNAFEGPPRIVRLFGKGTVHEFDTPEYNALIPLNQRQPGSRSAIVVDIHKVGSSCGYSIPFYEFKANRMKLHIMAARKESEDIKAESCTICADGPPLPEKGLKSYWKLNNANSIDGLPAMRDAFKSTTMFNQEIVQRDWGTDDERFATEVKAKPAKLAFIDARLLAGFVIGILVSGLFASLVGGVGLKTKVWWM